MEQEPLLEAYRIASSILAGCGNRARTTSFACEFASEKTGTNVDAILNYLSITSKSPFYR